MTHNSAADCDWPGKEKAPEGHLSPPARFPQRGLLLWRKPFSQMRAAAGWPKALPGQSAGPVVLSLLFSLADGDNGQTNREACKW